MSENQANPYPLRIDKKLMNIIMSLAHEHARSVNKEIEYALRLYVDNQK